MKGFRLHAPDGLVHEPVSALTRYFRTLCEHRWGDKWTAEDLTPTKKLTTCLQCLVLPGRSDPTVHEPLP